MIIGGLSLLLGQAAGAIDSSHPVATSPPKLTSYVNPLADTILDQRAVRAPDYLFYVEMLPHRSDDNSFIYQTPHFELHSEARLSELWAREFAMACESTLALFELLPLTVNQFTPQPKRFVVRLFSNRNNYLRAGGDPSSDACYLPNTGEVLLPLTSLKRANNSYFSRLENPFSALVHEVAHQLVHSSSPRYPVWFQEGIASLVQTLPLHNGSYQLGLENIEVILKRLDDTEDIACIHELFNMGPHSWQQRVRYNPQYAEKLYASSVVLTAYFLYHASDDLLRYVAAIEEGKSELLARQHLLSDHQDCAILIADIKRQFLR